METLRRLAVRVGAWRAGGGWGAQRQLAELFALDSVAELQDYINALFLSEAVYKPESEAAAALDTFAASLPAPSLCTLQALQFCREGLGHRYLLARSDTVLFLCCMGTKELRDLLADGNLLSRVLWAPQEGGTAAAAAAPRAQLPAAHRGFLSRADGIPVEALYRHARQQGLRLVVCGHSLGGAVAALCTLRLLAALGPAHAPSTRQLACVGFGMPALGNLALAEHVHRQGWDRFFLHFALPEDPVPRLLLQSQRQQQIRQPPVQAAAVEQLLQEEAGDSTSGASSAGGVAAKLAPGMRAAAAAAASALSRARAAVPLRSQPSVLSGSRSAAASSTADTPAQPLAGVAPQEQQPGSDAAMVRSDQQLPSAVPSLPTSSAQQAAAGRQGSASWASGSVAALSSAARGAAALLPTAPYPLFVHLGQQRFLLQGRASTQPPPPLAAPLALLAQPLVPFAHHSMSAYRLRTLGILRTGLGQVLQPSATDASSRIPPLQRHAALAPAVLVKQATARMPVLPLLRPVLPIQSSRPAERRPSVQRAAPAAAATTMVELHPPPQTSVAVAVSGSGLEMVTAARLQLPSAAAADVEASMVDNLAKTDLLAHLQPPPSQQPSASGWLARLRRHGTACAAGGAMHSRLVAHFQVPTAALLSLQLAPGGQQAAAQLSLLTDFGRHVATVELSRLTCWFVGLDASLASAAFAGTAAAADQAAAASLQSQQQRRWLGSLSAAAVAALPTLPVALPGSITAATGGGAAWLASAVPMKLPRPWQRGQQVAAEAQEPAAVQQPSSRWAAPLLSLQSSVSGSLAPVLHSLVQRVSPAGSQALPAVLAQGMLHVDATALLSGVRPLAQRVELAAEVVRWKLGPGAAAGPDVLSDEDWAMDHELSLGARLRRRLQEAGSTAQRRAALLRRAAAPELRRLQAPDVLVLLLRQDQLLPSSGGGRGAALDGRLLTALQHLASVCRPACVALLLAVATPQPLSPVYRRHLALAAGLGDSPGAVVPLLLELGQIPGDGSSGGSAGASMGLGVHMLQAAIAAHAQQLQRPAPLSKL